MGAQMSPLDSKRERYSEAEAAYVLGITVEELRFLVRTCILQGEEGGGELSVVVYRPADLVVLSVLSERRVLSTTVH
jgi:hypothetical protein